MIGPGPNVDARVRGSPSVFPGTRCHCSAPDKGPAFSGSTNKQFVPLFWFLCWSVVSSCPVTADKEHTTVRGQMRPLFPFRDLERDINEHRYDQMEQRVGTCPS